MPSADYCEIQVGGPRAKRRGVALVDVADAEAVRAYSWHMATNGYVIRRPRVGGKRLVVLLHREILGLGPGDPDVDHINGNELDNRRVNLRVATNAQNGQNRHERPYRGANWHAKAKRWRARVTLDGEQRHLGLFDTREEAVTVASAFRREHVPFSRDARETA